MTDLKVGDTFHHTQPSFEGTKEYKCHILAVVDNEYIVYKWYGKHKQYWHYQVEHKMLVEGMIKRHKKWLDEKKKDVEP